MMLSTAELQLIVLFAAGIASVMSLVLVHMWRTDQQTLPGLGWWAIGAPSILVAAIFFAMVNKIPAIFVILCGNLMTQLGAVAFYIGTENFYGKKTPRWPFAVTGALLFFLFIFGYLWPDYRARVIFITMAIFFVELSQAKLLWPRRRESFGVQLVLAGTLFRMVVVFYRFAAAPFGPVDAGPINSSPLQVIGVVATPLWLLAQTVGFMLMAEARLRERFQILASTDNLTGIMNRSAILREAESHHRRHVAQDRTMCVLLVDLDHFKNVNDQFGHLTGDDVLRDFARKVQAVLRPGDLFGRFGGEEFLVVLPDTDASSAVALVDRLRAIPPDVNLPSCNFSIGLAELNGRNSSAKYDTLDDIIKAADDSLYQAKSSGRNRLVLSNTA